MIIIFIYSGSANMFVLVISASLCCGEETRPDRLLVENGNQVAGQTLAGGD
ncbi:MAG TPA: hypothetical protein G4O09_06270 [Dehalococcoidia bacterium]|nr:hypothetical protein [Dehalococcoidia bacterium]